MQASTCSRVSDGYASRTSSTESPAARNSMTVCTVIRVPFTTGRPLQIAGSMMIQSFISRILPQSEADGKSRSLAPWVRHLCSISVPRLICPETAAARSRRSGFCCRLSVRGNRRSKIICPASRHEGKEMLYLHSITGHVSASTNLFYTSTAVKILPVELSFSIAALCHNL